MIVDNGWMGLLRRLWAKDAFVYSLRVFVALSSVTALCWALDHVPLVTPLFLGIIAMALAETDDSWRGRLRAIVVTLGCFALAAFSVQALLAWPPLFVLGLACSAFGFTMLGAMGERYRAIASATVILAIYTAISVAPGHATGLPHWLVPVLLLAGAAWYGALSLAWCALFPHQPVRQNLAQLYRELGAYLRLKASVFEPVRAVDTERRRLALAQTNGRVVAALNTTKESLFSRLGRQPPTGRLLRHLNLYFVAQDIHERASSSHYHYNEWADVLFHSDVLYRCQRVLKLQGVDCSQVAEALQLHQPYVRDGEAERALADLNDSIAYLERQQQPAWQRPLRSLRALARNLATLDAQLGAATHPEGGERPGDSSLFDRTPRSLADAWGRVRAQLHAGSPLARHAVRLSLALAAGCAAMQFTDPMHGYWIPLATLFVCQPTYGATLSKVTQRVLGTALGLVAGWALLRLFPSLHVQALIAVASGVLFFVTRTKRYLVATAAITLLVLMCFNQSTGNGYALIWPRLVDTLVGSAIAAAAMLLVLPDWQGRRLAAVVAQAVRSNGLYLREIMSQYATGKVDDLDYRLARRTAHNADAAFSTALAQMLQEPRSVRRHARQGMQMLVLSHTLLNFLSALGAHRGQLDAQEDESLVTQAADHAAAQIDRIAQALLERRAPEPDDGAATALADALERQADTAGEPLRLVLTQLALVCRQIAPLGAMAAQLVAGPESGEPAARPIRVPA